MNPPQTQPIKLKLGTKVNKHSMGLLDFKQSITVSCEKKQQKQAEPKPEGA